MSLEKLNMFAKDYLLHGRAETFSNLYDECRKEFQTVNRRRVTASGFGDTNDADSILGEVLFRLIRKGAVDGFGQQMSTALKNARTDFFRAEKARRRRYELTVDKPTEEDTPTSEVAEEHTLEEIVFIQQKKDDQRQLIAFLIDPSEVDAATTEIIAAFSKYESITALAKELGLHHEVVRRKIRKLARRYDANRFGDISEYLAV